jgi:hypothetical protein
MRKEIIFRVLGFVMAVSSGFFLRGAIAYGDPLYGYISPLFIACLAFFFTFLKFNEDSTRIKIRSQKRNK